MILTLGLVAMLSGFLIVTAVKATEGRIARNMQAYLGKAVFRVIPGADERKTFAISDDGFTLLPEGQETLKDKIYVGYKGGELVGVAIQASRMGYADDIVVLYGYNPATETVIGFTVLECKETPGLGDNINTDPDFLSNFEALDVKLNDAKTGLANPLAFVKKPEKTQAWQVEGISGATISSKAVTFMLNDSGEEILPLIAEHLDQLKAAK